MKLHDLRPPKGAKKDGKRVGRGTGSGHGKSAGRGTKGQGARSGGVKGRFFEGGQLPLVRRLPHKRGFTNLFRVHYEVVGLDRLAGFDKDSVVNPEALASAGIIASTHSMVKVLGNGDVAHAITVVAHSFSANARAKIEAAGGKVQVLS
jgi:large subunit ribosomal protein L15